MDLIGDVVQMLDLHGLLVEDSVVASAHDVAHGHAQTFGQIVCR